MIMRYLSRRAAALVAAAALALSAAACGSSSSSAPSGGTPAAPATSPASITTPSGVGHVRSRPPAILSRSPPTTEMLYAIGAGSQVKAVDSNSDSPPRAPKTKLNGFQPNLEAIVAYKPDLVVVSENVSGLAKHLAAFSIPVLYLPPPTSLRGVSSDLYQPGPATAHL